MDFSKMDYQIPIRRLCTIVVLFAVLIRDATLKSIDENEVNIIGGRFAKPNELPYQVSLMLVIIDKRYHVCGGSIINRNFVLSAAHCFASLTKENTIVRAGVIDYETIHEDRGLKSVKVHPEYNNSDSAADDSFSFYHDIALLEVDKPFTFDKSVQAVPLAKVYPPQGTKCVVSGWGLHNLDLMPDKDDSRLKLAEHLIGMQLFDNIYVTDYLTGIPFHGDSGGPLVCDGYLTGIVSRGQPNCTIAAGKALSIYTNVMNYKQWLVEKGVQFSDS